MSFKYSRVFTRENMERYLKEVAREYKKLNGKAMPAEIVLVGGSNGENN